MTKAQGLEVNRFVRALPESIHTVIVHCGAGVSRSCGVASALNAIYGFEVEEQRLKGANQSVKKLLIEVAKNQSRSKDNRRAKSKVLRCATKKE